MSPARTLRTRIACTVCLLTVVFTGPFTSFAAPAAPKSWRSALYPAEEARRSSAEPNFETDKFLQDFSYAGYAAGERSLPNVKEPVFTVTDKEFNADPTGRRDSTEAIQAAIQQAGKAGGGVVFLPAGTYRLSVPEGRREALLINKPHVILRGEGIARTFLFNTTINMRGMTVIRVEGPREASFFAPTDKETAINANLLTPTVHIPVSKTKPFQPGDIVVLRHDTTDAWVNEGGDPSWRGKGDILRGPSYIRQILSINEKKDVLTIDAPIRNYLKMRDKSRVHLLDAPPLLEVGLEDFSIGNREHPRKGWADADYEKIGTAAYDVASSYLIVFDRARDCWARRIFSYKHEGNRSGAHLLSNGVKIAQSSRITLVLLRLSHPQYGGGGGNGYMFRLQDANDCLLIRCQADYSRHGFVISHAGSSGNVLHECRDSRTGRTISTGRTSGAGSDHHMHFSHANLIDSSVADDSWWEARYRPYGTPPIHGVTAAHTVFWNTKGLGRNTSQPVVISDQGHYGYVIGTSGPRSKVSVPNRTITAPVDFAEGIGKGDTLVPASLYRDQLLRRTGRTPQD